MRRQWEGTGTAWSIEWGGRIWSVQLDHERPGLRSDECGPVLTLAGLAESGRWEKDALRGTALVGCECRFDRLEATYAPSGWGDITVRVVWSPAGDDGIDLLVQVNALSVDALHELETMLESTFETPSLAENQDRGCCWVEPRDAAAATLSYDRREPDLSRLVTLPPRALSMVDTAQALVLGSRPPQRSTALGPILVSEESLGEFVYLEMVHPEDASRRLVETRIHGGRASIRYGLFGYDLEKGVVLRGRLRGVWLRRDADIQQEAEARFRAFLHEPLPLST